MKSLGRILKVTLGVALALMLAYLVGMNAFLGTRWFRNAISFSPVEFRIEYARAYSILPGNIHVDGLSIRGSDGSVQWILGLDRCDFHVQFLDLLHRQFHADRVRGSGLSMRLRLRLEQDEAIPDLVAALPPVPGFLDPPLREIGPPLPPLLDAKYKLWSVRLDDVDAEHVREIWVQTLRYAGDIRVRGRWLFRPVRWLDIGPAMIDVSSLDISYGSALPLFTGLHGTVEATMHPFDVREPEGLEIVRYVSVKTSLSGSVELAKLLGKLAPAPSLKFVRGEGPIDLEFVVDRGKLRPGSRVSVSSSESEARAADLSIDAGLAAELRVEREGEEPLARVDLDVSHLRLARDDVELASAASVSLRLESRDVDLAKPSVETASYAVDLAGAQAPTVAFLRPFLPSGVTADSGAVSGDGHLEGRLEDESAHGQLGFALRDLTIARGTSRIGANVQAVVKVESGSVRDGRLDLTDSRVALEDVVAKVGGVPIRAPIFALRAMRAVVARDAPPNIDVDVDLPHAEVTDLRQILPGGGAFAVVGGRASAAMHLDVDFSSRSARGDVDLLARGLRVQVASDTYQGELQVVLKARSLGVDRKATVLSGSTLAFTSGGAPSTDDWWARVSLADASLQLAGETRFHGTVHMTAKNASPAQALLARVTPVPRFVLDAIHMDDLQVDGEIRESPSSLAAHSIVAKGSGNLVQLEYAKHDTDKQGMALLSAGSLRVGFTLAGPGKKFQLFDGQGDAEAWFGRQVADMRAHVADP